MIQSTYHPQHDLIVHTVTEELSADEFIEAGVRLYEIEPPPTLSLWDLSQASISDFDLESTQRVQSALKGRVLGRDGGKTAVVAPSDLVFGASRQYVILAESLELPFAQEVFRTLEDACEWLGVEALS